MSEFLLDEAMGANRVANINQQNMLLNAGQDDSAYDNFFANRPEGDVEGGVGASGSGGEQANAIVEQPAQNDDADYETAQDHQSDVGGDVVGGGGIVGGGGLIEEEQSQAPLIERRPSVNYSTESNMAAPWLPRSRNPARAGQARSNNVMGKYWRTFGERQSAIGGGLGGFFGALFGRGMKRANAIAGARNRRAAEREQEPLMRRSALRTRLENEGSATADDIKNYPREPGVKVNHRAALKARKDFNSASWVFNQIKKPSVYHAKDLGKAHAEYDLRTGTRSQPLDAKLGKHTADKFTAIVRANETWGANAAREDMNPHVPKPRLRNGAGAEKRVRFMDGANTEAAPVSRDPADFDPKPRPTGVKFHPVPLMGASREGLTWKQRRALAASERAATLSDDAAVAQEQELWPIGNRLSRMDPDRLEVTGMNAGMQAHMLGQENPAPDSPQAQQLREAYVTGELAGDISSKRLQENNERAKRAQAAFPTEEMSEFQQYSVMQDLMASGDRRWRGLDPSTPLHKQMPQIPSRYFKNRYWGAYDAQRAAQQPQSDSVVGEDASDAGNDAQSVIGGGGGDGGGGGLIQEEPDPVQQQPLPHEAWHVLQQK